jgi:DNA-binding response OmpR family regulator
VLDPLGFTVLTAPNGQAGLEMALEYNPDLIMLDMSMPVMTGMEMLQALHQTLFRAPVIFMTMFGSESIAVEAFRLGVRDYLPKPFTVDEVQEAVENALRESRLAREKERLLRELIAAESTRKTLATLSNSINNDLYIINGGLGQIALAVQRHNLADPKLQRILQDCLTSANRVGAVLRVMNRVTQERAEAGQGEIAGLDIEAAMREELGRA